MRGLPLLVYAGLFYLMMRFGCGAPHDPRTRPLWKKWRSPGSCERSAVRNDCRVRPRLRKELRRPRAPFLLQELPRQV
jgi:hypothetical protein